MQYDVHHTLEVHNPHPSFDGIILIVMIYHY
jgi:hypothetical protein